MKIVEKFIIEIFIVKNQICIHKAEELFQNIPQDNAKFIINFN